MTRFSEPSQRQLRVGEAVRHALSQALARGAARDPLLERATITVPEVRMTADLKVATVLVMPLAGRDREAVLDALNRERGHLRRLLAGQLRMKFLPDLRFVLDTRYDDDARIDALLHSPAVARDLEKRDDGPDGGARSAPSSVRERDER